MFKCISIGLMSALLSTSVLAQEIGVIGGFHQTSASAKTTGVSDESEIGYRFGVSAKFEMLNKLNFKTGLIYAMRPFELSNTTTTFSHDFSYLDIPALVEVRMNETVGLSAGLVMAINLDDKVRPAAQVTGTTDIMPLFHGGVSLLFEDMYGFDLFIERGLGDVYDGAKDITSFGANFVFWL